MAVLSSLKHHLKRVPEHFGFDIVRKGTWIPVNRRAETSAELEAMYQRFVFPELSPRETRASLLARLEGTQVSEAIYVIEYLRRSLELGGDVCEFGVAQGATSALLADEIRSTDASLWLFDSFEGLPRPGEKDVLMDDIFGLGSMAAYEGTMAFGATGVMSRLSDIRFPLSRVRVVPGFVEETLEQRATLTGRVCFAYIDMDFYEPIRVALDFLHSVLPVGGHVVVDDYGRFSAGAQTAVDEFVMSRAGDYEVVHPLPPAGQFVVLARIS